MCSLLGVSAFRGFTVLPSLHPTVGGEDYTGIVDIPLDFIRGQNRACHTVMITQDASCEIEQIEDFFSILAYVSGVLPIIINPSRTLVIIDDTNETECGK